MKKTLRNILLALALVALGVLLLLKALNIYDVNLFFPGWWTLFIIVPPLFFIIEEGFSFAKLMVISVGVILLIWQQGYVTSEQLWPIFGATAVTGVGMLLLYKVIFRKMIQPTNSCKNQEQSGAGNQREHRGVFDGFSADYAGQPFEGTDCRAVFGGGQLDLTNAIIAQDCTINCEAIFGGMEIYLPYEVNIKVVGSGIFGGVENKRKGWPHRPEYPTVTIRAKSVFGGVSIDSSRAVPRNNNGSKDEEYNHSQGED